MKIFQLFLSDLAPVHDQLADAAADYLKRSHEEMTFEEEWTALMLAMTHSEEQGMALLVATEDTPTGPLLAGFCLLRLLPGTSATGPLVSIWQVYIWPGRTKVSRLYATAWPQILDFAHKYEARRLILLTHRAERAYIGYLRKLGFHPYGIMYQQGVS